MLNKKGQMIVIDILFAIAVITLMFIFMVKTSESDVYSSNYKKQTEKINRIGELALYSFLNNSESGCFVKDTDNNFFIPGTIKTPAVITKENLSIPSDYGCNLSVSGITITSNECNSSVPATNEIYSVDFVIASCTADLTKKEYLNCMSGGSCLRISEKTGTLKIWKS